MKDTDPGVAIGLAAVGLMVLLIILLAAIGDSTLGVNP